MSAPKIILKYTYASVGKEPRFMVIHKGLGFVMNYGSHDVVVVNLSTWFSKEFPISVQHTPISIQAHNGFGYVRCAQSYSVVVINLETLKVVGYINNPKNLTVDFSDTHVYFGRNQVHDLFK